MIPESEHSGSGQRRMALYYYFDQMIRRRGIVVIGLRGKEVSSLYHPMGQKSHLHAGAFFFVVMSPQKEMRRLSFPSR